MGELGRRQVALYALALLVVGWLGVRYLGESGRSGGGGAPGRPVPVRVSGGGSGDGGGWVVVQVAGEVRNPGVYRLRAGKRVDDAVRMAGGATSRAEPAGVNLAAKVEDGRQVIVPARAAGGAAVAGGVAGAGGAGAGEGAGGEGVGGVAGAPAARAAAGAPLNLNTATPEQLDALDGVGPATAQKIVAYRQARGGFRSVAELDQVPGIGPKRLAALKPLVTV